MTSLTNTLSKILQDIQHISHILQPILVQIYNQKYLIHISDKFQTYLRHMKGITHPLLAICKTNFRHTFDISKTNLRYIHGIFMFHLINLLSQKYISDIISLICLRNISCTHDFSGISQANLEYIQNLFLSYPSYISDISQKYFRHIWHIFQASLRCISKKSQAYLRHIYGISQTYQI